MKRRPNRERNVKREFLVVTWKLINGEREKRSILFVKKIGNSCHVTIVSRGKAIRTRVKVTRDYFGKRNISSFRLKSLHQCKEIKLDN